MTQSTSENTEVRYKIGDVCRIADVQPYVLRYWESEFPLLAPDRSIPGPRSYSAREVDLIGQIKRLLYDEGYTIAGAKKRLESEASGARSRDTIPAFIPGDLQKVDKSDKSDKPVPPEKAAPERTVKPPERPPARRAPSRSSASVSVDTLPGLGEADPAAAASAAELMMAPVASTPDPRVARVVAELKEILEILSRD
jgi:DNA-binding transcriptional MerR regulator